MSQWESQFYPVVCCPINDLLSWYWISSAVFTQTKLYLTGQRGICSYLAGEAVCTDERFSARNVQSGGIYAKFTVSLWILSSWKTLSQFWNQISQVKYKYSICNFYRKKPKHRNLDMYVTEQNMITRFTLIFSASAHYERILYNPEMDSRLLYQLLKKQVDMKSQMILVILKSL